MNTKAITTTMAMSLLLAGCSPKKDATAAYIDKVVNAMTPEEKAAFVIGTNRVSETPPDAPDCLTKYPLVCEKFQNDAEKYGVDGWEQLQNFVATYSTQGRVPGAAGQHYELPALGL